MDATRIGVIAISSFFILSIVATAFIYSFPEPEPPVSDFFDDLEPTQLAAEADEVQGKVLLLLPKLKLMSNTSKTDIFAIDASIAPIQGVKRVDSFFSQQNETELALGLIYIADVLLEANASAEDVFSEISENPFLDSPQGFPFVLVSLPKEIEFTNPDLNISKTYSLKRNEAESLASFETLVGDEVEISLNAVFVGDEVVSLVGYETKNITSEPVFGETSATAAIAFLEPTLLLDISAEYSQLSLLDEVKQQAFSLSGIKDLNLNAPEIEAKLSLVGDGNLSAETASDLNSFLNTLSDDVIFYNQDFFRASLFFEQGTDLAPLKAIISEKLSELGIEGTLIAEPIGHAFGEISLESGNASTVFSGLESIIESKGFSEFSIQQPGQAELSEITHEETVYPIESGLVDAMFSQQHAVGKTVPLAITYYIVREEIAFANAVEEN